MPKDAVPKDGLKEHATKQRLQRLPTVRVDSAVGVREPRTDVVRAPGTNVKQVGPGRNND